tara:strand:- start:2127 stop:2276 length:150 start_codon:yes stop_codon:yes gene_type:complete
MRKRRKKKEEKCSNCKFYGWNFCKNLEKEGFLIVESSNSVYAKKEALIC